LGYAFPKTQPNDDPKKEHQQIYTRMAEKETNQDCTDPIKVQISTRLLTAVHKQMFSNLDKQEEQAKIPPQ